MILPTGRCVRRWLSPLAAALPELTERDWSRLADFEEALRDHLTSQRMAVLTATDPGKRSQPLLDLRRALAGQGFTEMPDSTGVAGSAELQQALRQAICGYYDLDLRDATGLGHGQMIARHAQPGAREQWLPRIAAGELAGIAMTEAHGGNLAEITTRLVPAVRGGYVLAGVKSWISRLNEADVWIVFARDPAGGVTAVLIDAASPAVHREPRTPAGLAGWSWGKLIFDGAPVATEAILGSSSDGLSIFTEHIAHYRPLITATALGTAAGVHDTVTAHLSRRVHNGEINRVHDHALIATGRAYGQINAGFLASLHTQRLSATGSDKASLWGRTTKALGVDLARHAADELIVLIGASGFQAAGHLQKARRDLDALRYADGMHDSLYRAAGRALLHGRNHREPADRRNVPAAAPPERDRDGATQRGRDGSIERGRDGSRVNYAG